jgi:hypothetical protein
MNAAARMIFSTSRYSHVTPFLRQLFIHFYLFIEC